MSGKKIASKVLQKIRAQMEEVEELDELSKDTAASYIRKAAGHDFDDEKANLPNLKQAGSVSPKERDSHTSVLGNISNKDIARNVRNRNQGIKRALNKLTNEELEEIIEDIVLNELSKTTLASYIPKAIKSNVNLSAKAAKKEPYGHEDNRWEKAAKRAAGVDRALDKLTKEETEISENIGHILSAFDSDENMKPAGRKKNYGLIRKHLAKQVGTDHPVYKKVDKHLTHAEKNHDKCKSEEDYWKEMGHGEKAAHHEYRAKSAYANHAFDLKESADMLDTSLSDVDASSKGEVYKKSSEKTTAPTKPTGTKTGVTSTGSGEAYNTTPGTKRMPAVEHAIRGIMERTYEVRKIRAEAAEISIGTPEQRQDWMNVEQGKMDVVDYFNKYRITGDE